MIDIDELRRLAQAATPGPWRVYDVGVGFEIAAGDNVIAQAQSIPRDSVQHAARRANAAFIAAANPAAISELLDCLEAAESDGLEQARLNGMGGEREAALLSKLEAAEKERDALRAENAALVEDMNLLRNNNVALRAKIERMEGALESLLIRCDDSDSAMYGTLSTSFVRDTVRIARGAKGEEK